uniref:Transposase domain-containing protein n=1 Tax=Anopheles funestus TaxID=62324 RepID=A0A182S0E5_ANOFN
ENSSEDESEEIISFGGVSQFKNMILKDALQYWALTTHQPGSSVNMILEIFHECTIYKNLPKDARTILQTPRTSMNITDIDGGRYFYNGIKRCLINRLEHVQFQTLYVNVSIDGLPLFKGSPSSFWPILINVQEIPILSPMIVAMFHGITKPPELEQYLRPFVEEMNEVLDNGIPIKNRVVRVRLRAFISDSPARSYIKEHGCLKCCRGEHSYQSRTVYFWDSNAPERTDELFRRMAYPKHYRIYTPLLDLQYLNIIEDIVVADRLHLIDLGVMRRLLKAWVKGVFGTVEVAPENVGISKTLEKMQLPSEIHR